MPPMIEAAGVVKRFGKTKALDGLELFAEQGSILAVLGPNGAGKHLQLAYQPAAQAVDVELTLLVDEPPGRRGKVAEVWSCPREESNLRHTV